MIAVDGQLPGLPKLALSITPTAGSSFSLCACLLPRILSLIAAAAAAADDERDVLVVCLEPGCRITSDTFMHKI